MSSSRQANETRTVQAVCARLGVPTGDWSLFERWADELVMGTQAHALDGLDGYIDMMIADRCFRTTDDLLTDLIMIGVDGEDLTSEEIMLAVRTMLLLARKAEITDDQERRTAS